MEKKKCYFFQTNFKSIQNKKKNRNINFCTCFESVTFYRTTLKQRCLNIVIII